MTTKVMTPEERYLQVMGQRTSMLTDAIEEGDDDFSLGLQEQKNAQLQGQQPSAGAKTSGQVSQLGGAMTTGGMMSGNPYVAGAGLALQTIGQVDDAQRQAEQAKIDAYNKKVMAQRASVRNFFE